MAQNGKATQHWEFSNPGIPSRMKDTGSEELFPEVSIALWLIFFHWKGNLLSAGDSIKISLYYYLLYLDIRIE